MIVLIYIVINGILMNIILVCAVLLKLNAQLVSMDI
jgi:hypothetical protein